MRINLTLVSKTDIFEKTAFGIRINPNMVVVDGHVLSSPRLKYGGSAVVPTRNGSWNMSGKTFVKPASMPSWTLLRIGLAANPALSAIMSQLRALISVFKKLGMKTVMPKDLELKLELPRAPNGEPGINKSVVDKSLEQFFEKHKQEGIGMFLVVLPSEDAWLFNRIKFWGDVVFGMVPQF